MLRKSWSVPSLLLKDIKITGAEHPGKLNPPKPFSTSSLYQSFNSLNDADPLPTRVPAVWGAGRGCQVGWGTGEGLELTQCTAQPLLRSPGPWQLGEGFKLDKTSLVLLSSSALRAPRG